MLLAKHNPGVYEVPYVSDMNISSVHTGLVHTNQTFESIYSKTSDNLQQPGTRKYTVILYSPLLSVIYGSGGAGFFPSTSKLGGLAMYQVDSATDAYISFDLFQRVDRGVAMSAIYGSQGDTFAENAFIWASKATFTLEAPSANSAGIVTMGHFPISSLVDKSTSTAISVS